MNRLVERLNLNRGKERMNGKQFWRNEDLKLRKEMLKILHEEVRSKRLRGNDKVILIKDHL